MNTIIRDYEEFKDSCWWWPEVQKYIDGSLPQGWAFYSAFDLNGRGLKYMVTFRQFEPVEYLHIAFHNSSGVIRISGGAPGEQ